MNHISSHSRHPTEFDRRSTILAPAKSIEEINEDLARVMRVDARISPDSRLVMHTDPYSMEADKFRTLRVYLRGLAKASGLKAIMVTSAVLGEGKSVCSLNLAASLAERGGNRVILVEADLRNPIISKRLGLDAWNGLTHCLTDGSDPLKSLRYVKDVNLYLLSAGEICTNPIQILNSDRFTAVVERLRYLADWVIFDCPPVVPVPDVLAMRANMDGYLWVVRSNMTSRTVMEDAINKVGRDMLLGVILNDVKTTEAGYGSYYSYEPLMLGPGS